MTIYFVIILAIVARFIPHMPNFAPITALAIFSAANMGWKKSALLVLTVRFISDIFLGFFAWPMMLAVYASHLVGILFGLWIKNSPDAIPSASEGSLKLETADTGFLTQMHSFGMASKKWLKILGSSLTAAVLFFLVTNFAFLYPTYSHNLSGIISAYINGLPFFRGTALGDLSYTLALFGSYEFVKFLTYQKSSSLKPSAEGGSASGGNS